MLLIWAAYVVVALLLLDVVEGTAYAATVTAGALVLAAVTRPGRSAERHGVDRRDLAWIGLLYLGVVALFRVAFVVFTPEATAPMFLAFAVGLLLGTMGPLVYTVWLRGRPLATLGLGRVDLPRTIGLAALFAGVQFSITLAGTTLPAPIDWVPLLVMSLTVGAFESVFFRGFVQGRLATAFGPAAAVAGSAVLYALYHVGYGMGAGEIAFLFGLGVVYAIAFAVGGHLLVLWPLLTPLGSFYAQLESGELAGDLPWASIAGFGDVLAVMAVCLWLAHRHLRRRDRARLVSADVS